ncbi:decarboxylating cobalt-precorrin-6B (C(15))-methyltransferase [Lentilactobacillus raoultii]|uniref:Decarboxylating cobalt-precorrin-6B (C(15))-methyltransferase n=1 Tax=Lentilactobacillus raoultii TaxID=1987503 RepID=A0ABW3PI71_9LACO|nr:decarboxylating cobalt-precorrin-6B (C(15))-methyltransferase [Lentilactobacillus raoultii]
MRDELFLRNKVPMTKSEIRAISLNKLDLTKKDKLLDIGAGTGSISLEAALTFPQIEVTSIEQKSEAVEIMNQNIQKFEVNNIHLIQGSAPEGIPDKEYDAIFIGGSGAKLNSIIDFSLNHLKLQGSLVLNFILYENAMSAISYLEKADLANFEVVQVSVAKWHALGKGHFFKPRNPTFVISAEKKG